MNLTDVKAKLAEKRNFNAYIKGTERVRVVGTTEKMVKVNVYDGTRLVRDDKDNYVTKLVKPTSLTISKEKTSTSNNKPKGVYEVLVNGTSVAKDIDWNKAKSVFKTKSEKGKEGDTFAIHKLENDVRAEKPSMAKTLKKRVSKSRTNEYIVRVEGNDVTEKGNFKDTLSSYKERVDELTNNEEWGTKVEMIKFDKENKETISREITLEKPVEEETPAETEQVAA